MTEEGKQVREQRGSTGFKVFARHKVDASSVPSTT